MSNPYDPYAPGGNNQPEGQPMNSQPVSQPSAGWDSTGQVPSDGSYSMPNSQPSAGWEGTGSIPTSQPSSGWEASGAIPTSQPSSSWEASGAIPTSEPSSSWDTGAGNAGGNQWAAAGAAQGANQWGSTASAPTTARKEGGLGAIFDFSFSKYATPSIAKIVYILVLVMAGLGWLGYALMMFVMGTALGRDGGPVTGMGVAWLLLGWIPALLQVIIFRIFMELAIANIRTAEDVDVIRQKVA